jgi:BASS family bile acid:Na+ symporter
MGKLATVGLAPAVFAPIMNITGSSLALWWRGHPLEQAIEKMIPADASDEALAKSDLAD